MKAGSGRFLAAFVVIWLLLFWWHFRVHATDLPESLDLTVIVKYENTYDSSGLEFFTLKTPKGRFLVSADADLPVARWLKGRDGERVSVSLNGR